VTEQKWAGPITADSRNAIIERINLIGVAKNWKIILDVDPATDKVRLSFFRKSGIEITFLTKQPIWLFATWSRVRELCEYSYDEILLKLDKYPFLLETEQEFHNER